MSASNKQSSRPILLFSFLSLIFIGTEIHLAYTVSQIQFYSILGHFALMFGIFALLIKNRIWPTRWLLTLAIVGRVVLIPAFPALSDDIYRFAWDGYLLQGGINPFQYTPQTIFELDLGPSSLRDLYQYLNSAQYFTVYPPYAQLTFWMASWTFSLFGAMMALKIILFIGEMVSIWVLPRLLRILGLAEQNAWLYLLNPLLIIEVMGNLHYEGWLMAWLFLALYGLFRGQWIFSAGSFALSILTKLTSLMYTPLLLFYLGWKRAWTWYVIVVAVLALGWLPFVNQAFVENFSNSLNLYFQSFEFNASVYYIIRWFGYLRRGFNIIADAGPALSLIPIVAIGIFALLQRRNDHRQLVRHFLFSFVIYLFCATTVHPWYIIIPIGLSCLTDYRFPIVWSFLAIVSYSHYDGGIVQERMGWVALEYIIVTLFAIYEILSKQRSITAG